jgi:hypothetical protein
MYQQPSESSIPTRYIIIYYSEIIISVCSSKKTAPIHLRQVRVFNFHTLEYIRRHGGPKLVTLPALMSYAGFTLVNIFYIDQVVCVLLTITCILFVS